MMTYEYPAEVVLERARQHRDLIAEVKTLRARVAEMEAAIDRHRDEQTAIGDGSSPADDELWATLDGAAPDQEDERG